MRIASLSLLALCLAVVPAMAQTEVYDNGPTNGTTDGWTINFGFAVSDSFTTGGGTVNGLNFAAWLFPGDVLQNAEVSITSEEFGGTTYFDGTVNFTQSGCVGNQYGYNVCNKSSTFTDTSLSAGTYWLNIQNANVNTGDPVYWDENSGPSSASENAIGTIPSESFTLYGGSGAGSGSGSGSGSGTVPEPSSIMLFGSGILGLAGVLRRKLF